MKEKKPFLFSPLLKLSLLEQCLSRRVHARFAIKTFQSLQRGEKEKTLETYKSNCFAVV